MKAVRRLWLVMKRTGGLKIFVVYFIAMCVVSAVLMIAEPHINTFFDSLWYCFIATTTIGFGDIYTVTPIGRIITVFISLYGIIITAVLTGVIVSYYMEYIKIKENETISVFLEELEELPNLSKDKLKELSERVKRFNSK